MKINLGFCCEGMKLAVCECVVHIGSDTSKIGIFDISLYMGEDEENLTRISYCPFCGERIEAQIVNLIEGDQEEDND